MRCAYPPYDSLSFLDAARQPVAKPSAGEMLVKLPYAGGMTKASKVAVAFSANGKAWQKLPAKTIVDFAPAATQGGGYVVFRPTQAQFAKLGAGLAIVE